MYADIIVDISSGQLDKAYQYRIPERLLEKAVIGAPAEIPFGRTTRKGYIVDLSEEPKIEESRIKDLLRIEEKGLVIESKMIALAYYLKEQFGGTMNDALQTVIPVKKSVRAVEEKRIVLAVSKEIAGDALALAVRKKHVARERLLRELIREKEMAYEIVTEKLGVSAQTIASLEKENILRVERITNYRNPLESLGVEDTAEDRPAALTPEQEHIVSEIVADFEGGIRKKYLLHGVTGSGKTEVYLSIIEAVIKMGKQVIVLIPEIALTYQTLKRFYHRFPNRVSILNSRMSAGERYDQSMRAKNGEIDVMIGPRSALFTPFLNLGMIIIDEEHETSYKSEITPKYHAREVAGYLAKLSNASVILGSATPSVEAYEGAKNGEYHLYTLKNRAVTGATLPGVEIVDLREELKSGNRSIFSRRLRELMQDRLQKKEQMMLFLNRRGYAGFVSCRSCGQVMKCPHCDISLTAHNNGKLVCHYCGYETVKPSQCPKCQSPYIAAFGTGTQKIEEMVQKEFPGVRILRMDADTTKTKESYSRILSAFSNQEADILIGTQMIVKGHDFPMVTLVGILAADLSLNANDYRASERTFSLLAQAAGRAGRGKRPGNVVIQTYQPEHYSIRLAAKEDYEGFFEKEIAFRKALKYPPCEHILAILVISKVEENAERQADRLLAFSQEHTRQTKDSVCYIGPAPANLSKANDFYRRVLYARSSDYNELVALKNFLEGYIVYSDHFRNVNVQFDFNPMNTY